MSTPSSVDDGSSWAVHEGKLRDGQMSDLPQLIARVEAMDLEELRRVLRGLSLAVDAYWNAGPTRRLNGPEATEICAWQGRALQALDSSK